MKTYFYVIEWRNGNSTSGLILNAVDSEDAYKAVMEQEIKPRTDKLYGPVTDKHAGIIVTFNRVD